MQVSDHGDNHHPSRLTRALAVLVAALAAIPAAGAAAPRYTALPSPSAPLTSSPPVSGGAAASAEGVRHRIAATTSVRVSVDEDGTPFAVQAVQRLDVSVQGDYFFTIGAPVVTARAAPGSHSLPGVRSTSILWAGFNPGRRTLAATISLEPRVAVAGLPMRLERGNRRVTLRNVTATDVPGFTADAQTAPLRRYARLVATSLARGATPPSGGALITSPPRQATFRVLAMLHVVGTIGSRRIDLVLGAAPMTFAAGGSLNLRVRAVPPRALLRLPQNASGEALLRRLSTALLDVARARQYSAYLGNPDPAGRNVTTYTYRSATRAPIATPVVATPAGNNALRTLAVIVGLLAALAVSVVVWARA